MEDKARLARELTNPATWEKEGGCLKFDAVVGNPPYQRTGGSGGTNDAPIYQEFAALAEKLDPSYLSLIIPSRWFSGGRENLLADFRKNMLANRGIRKMYAFTDSRDIFPTVEIKGGLCYYLYDKKYSGGCQYTLVQNEKRERSFRDLGDFDILIREPQLANIVKKVMEQVQDQPTVQTMISGDTPFGIPTNPTTSSKNTFELYDTPDAEHDTELLYLDKMVRRKAYIRRDHIRKNVTDIGRDKVFIPKASGSGTDPYVVGKPECGPKNSVCSQTFLYAAFNSPLEAHNFISYLCTKFFRALVSACKISQETPRKVYRYVPLQDFSKPWTEGTV